MVRTLLAPRMLALHLALIGILISFTLLGRWQLGVFEGSASERLSEAARKPPVPIGQVTQPGRRFGVDELGRAVTVTGTFQRGGQLLVAGKGDGFWVLTPMKTDQGVLPVVRGRVPRKSVGDSGPGNNALAVPGGEVTLTGRLQVDDDAAPRTGLPEGQIGRVSTADLVNLWPGRRLYGGYLVAERVEGGAGGLAKVAAQMPVERSFEWRNLAYALQWWIFAGFAVFMWWHIVRDQHRKRGSK